MIRKLLFVSFLLVSTLTFSQKNLEKVYAAPNPFSSETKIHIKSKLNQTVFFTVKNILGKTVHKKRIKIKKGQNSIPFSRNNLLAGVYIYSIKNNKEFISKRLVIQ